MASSPNNYAICANGVATGIGPVDEREWVLLESLVRAEYERCHPDDTFVDLKRRARFSKEDQGLLYDWMARAAGLAVEKGGSETAKMTQANARRDGAVA
jgi:hypothetical protein